MLHFIRPLAGWRSFWAVVLVSSGIISWATLSGQAQARPGFRPMMPMRPATPQIAPFNQAAMMPFRPMTPQFNPVNTGVASAAQVNANVQAAIRQQHVPGSPFNLLNPGSPFPHVPFSVANSRVVPFFPSGFPNRTPFGVSPFSPFGVRRSLFGVSPFSPFGVQGTFNPAFGLNTFNPYSNFSGSAFSSLSNGGYGGYGGGYGGYGGGYGGSGSLVYPYVSPYATQAANTMVPPNVEGLGLGASR